MAMRGGFGHARVARSAMAGLAAGAFAFIGLDALAIYDEETKRPARPPMVTVAAVYVDAAEDRSAAGMREALPPAAGPSGRKMRFTLEAGGVLAAEGSIETGAASRFAGEIAALGDRVAVLSLDSPGGSLDDAMAMAQLVRERGLSTEVAAGAVCASSCPLLLAGGVSRRVDADAAVALHQFYAAPGAVAHMPGREISEAQSTAARIVRHLSDMGVDPSMWLHAFDTPPQRLYYLSREELAKYRLVDGNDRHAAGM